MSSTQLKTLSNNFNSLLTEYKNTYNDYINNINDTSLTTLDNSAYNGTSILNTNTFNNVDDCKSSCESNSSCSGATFTTNNNCILSSGNGNITNSTDSTAIVQKGLYYSYKLQKLNQQLMDINQEISNNMNQSYGDYQDNLNKSQQQEQSLQQNYDVLNKERQQIENMIKEFETLNSAQANGDIKITMYYYNYIFLLLIVILLVFLLVKFSFDGQQIGGGNKFNFFKIFKP